MTPDELKSIPKGQFVVMKTGTHPMQTRLRLFLEWGITFGEPYLLPERAARTVSYASKQELEEAIFRRCHAGQAEMEPTAPPEPAALPAGSGRFQSGRDRRASLRTNREGGDGIL